MKIRAEQLPDQIKKQLLPVYVISGGDPLLTQEAADSIRAGARAQGFSERDIWDIAAVAGFFNMTNRVASATDMQPNPEYHSQNR